MFHEYLIQHSLKSVGTQDHFRQINYLVPPLIERPDVPNHKVRKDMDVYQYVIEHETLSNIILRHKLK